jgi:hypothetical protein
MFELIRQTTTVVYLLTKAISEDDKLNENNYTDWIFQMEPLLSMYGVDEGIENSDTKNDSDKRNETVARYLIISNVTKEQRAHSRKCTTVKDMWNTQKKGACEGERIESAQYKA